MSEIKVVGWTSFDCEYPTKQYTQEEVGAVLQAVRQEIANNGYRFSGSAHQFSLTGAPILSDGTCFRASMRCWGSIMASIHSSSEEQLGYMEFYTETYGEEIMPPQSEITVAPAVLEQDYFGFAIQQDAQVLSEAASFGMPFMTTDKVLKKLYAKGKIPLCDILP